MSKDSLEEDLTNLMLLGFDEIDYDTLSTEMLKRLALGNELYIATSALGELEIRDERVAAFIASEILENSHGDKYLQSSALGTLFRLQPEQAFKYIINIVETCDPYILNTILELLLENSTFVKGKRFSELIKIILDRLNNSDLVQETIDQEIKKQFLGHFQSND